MWRAECAFPGGTNGLNGLPPRAMPGGSLPRGPIVES